MGGRRQLPDIMGDALGRLGITATPPPQPRPVLVPLAAPEAKPRTDLADRLGNLGLKGMAQALLEEVGAPTGGQPELLAVLDNILRREEELRHQRSEMARLRRARLPQQASLEKLDQPRERGLGEDTLHWLEDCAWVAEGRTILLVGAVGSGKTFLASALVRRACMAGHSALYARLPDVLATLAMSRVEGRWAKTLAAYARPQLLALDDMGLFPLRLEQTADLLELAEARYGRRSTLIASAVSDQDWADLLPPGLGRQALLDRWLPGALRIVLKGDSRRA